MKLKWLIGVAAMGLAGPSLAQACDIKADDQLVLWPGVADMPTTRTQSLAPQINPQSYAPGAPMPEDCRVRWSADRPYARIKGDKLTIRPGAPDGEILTVTGEVKTSAGPRRIKGQLFVFDPAKHPAIGNWRQAAIDCPGGEGPGQPLNELILDARGGFKATWTPFETYVDYWGTYDLDPATGALTLKPTGGNHVPQDAVLSGKASVAGKEMTITGVSFGQPDGPTLPATCRIRFTRN